MTAIATPSQARLKLTPSNSPFLSRPSRPSTRGRSMLESRLSLKRVVGTTCRSSAGFDTANSSLAYIAGGTVVIVDIENQQYPQRFYRARPNALPIYSISVSSEGPSTPTTATPKANDSRNRVALGYRDSPFNNVDWTDSPTGSKTWTSRERIKAVTCLALSPDGKYLAVGETGYAPRVMIFSLSGASSDTPLVSISEHAFGVTSVAWSQDSRFLASLGAANDGFLFVWKLDQRTGAVKLFQQNRCTSCVKAMIWLGNGLITLGVRHVKIWTIEEAAVTSPSKLKFSGDSTVPPPTQKALPGRNILLGSLLEATFSCGAVSGNNLILCTEAGDVCILEDDENTMKLTRVMSLGYPITTLAIRDNVAYVAGKEGHIATLNVEHVLHGCADLALDSYVLSTGVVALGFLSDKLVVIDSNQSIDLWKPESLFDQTQERPEAVTFSGCGQSILGVHSLCRPNKSNTDFVTWSASGNMTFWDLNGQVKHSFDIPRSSTEPENETRLTTQLSSARASTTGNLLITADCTGVVKIIDADSTDCLLDTKAHSSDILSISIFDEECNFLMACCGRDRTAQLFHRNSSSGEIEHFQTLEFAAKVVQVLVPAEDKLLTCSLDRTLLVHEIVCREGEPDVLAAITAKVISLKASPTSMAMSVDNRSVFVSLVDRTVCQFDLNTGRQMLCFKCLDESGAETVVLESLSAGHWLSKDFDFLLGLSNTDKSIRIYDAGTGAFMGREWGHTEAINGVCFLEEEDGGRKVVSVGSDGTIMIWALDLTNMSPRLMSRDPSPVKDATVSARPALRKVLSKAELAEFQRASPSPGGRRSPPRTVRRRTSRLTLGASSTTNKTPAGNLTPSPSDDVSNDHTPTRRRPSEANTGHSPPASPKPRCRRTPSLPALPAATKRKNSAPNLHAFGSLSMATEQACRTLRAYRKKLSSAEPVTAEVLTELDQELRLTAAALGDRAIRSNALNETALSELLDQYSEKLVTLLDEKLQLTKQPPEDVGMVMTVNDRPRSADGSSSSSSP